jgi:hypothetical protein
MDSDERDIYNYLKCWPGQFVFRRDIARLAGGKWKYRDNPDWAELALMRLLERGILETDATGYFRLRCDDKDNEPAEEKEPLTKWLSPQIQNILKQSGKNWNGATAPGGFRNGV